MWTSAQMAMLGSFLGVFLMGATLVVTSFTCTAPFGSRAGLSQAAIEKLREDMTVRASSKSPAPDMPVNLNTATQEQLEAAALDGPDHALLLAGIAEHAADLADRPAERCIAHGDAGPHRLDDLAARHDAVAVVDQVQEHVEHLGLDGDGGASALESVAGRIQREAQEPQPRAPHGCQCTAPHQASITNPSREAPRVFSAAPRTTG
jgi:hypothetical protein